VNSANLFALGNGSTFLELGAAELASFRVPLPERRSQSAIADFLDSECERIGALLRAKQAQRADFDGLRSSIVREACAHLSTRRLRHGWRVVDCKHRTPVYRDDGCPVISTREVRRGVLDVGAAERFVSDADARDLREGGRDPRLGDIVYSRNATVGVASYVAGDQEICMGQDVVLVTRRPRDSHVLSYFLNWGVADQVARASLGSTFSRINVDTIRELQVPCDSESAERRALTTVRPRFGAIDAAESELVESERLLAEYRDALITEAVTGKLDVTTLSDIRLDESARAAVEGEPPEVLAS